MKNVITIGIVLTVCALIYTGIIKYKAINNLIPEDIFGVDL